MLAGVPYGMVSVSCSGVFDSEKNNGEAHDCVKVTGLILFQCKNPNSGENTDGFND